MNLSILDTLPDRTFCNLRRQVDRFQKVFDKMKFFLSRVTKHFGLNCQVEICQIYNHSLVLFLFKMHLQENCEIFFYI